MTATSRSARYARWLSIPLGLAISALLIWQASYAAFTDMATSRDNTWTAGHVTIDRAGDEGEPLFTVPNLAPGDHETKEVTVNYSGSLAATVSFYAESELEDVALAEKINLQVLGAGGGTFAGPTGVIYNGTLAEFLDVHPTFERGIKYDVTKEPPYRTGTFQFRYDFPEDAPSTLQKKVTAIDFIVEAQHIPKQ